VHHHRLRDSDVAFNDELLAEVFPDVPRRNGIGAHTMLLGIERARRMLGYEPQHRRDA
jgi:UDP-glucose 4-epimerase